MGRRVLIVDDSFSGRMVLRDLITYSGYKVVGEAKNGQESLDKYQELKPDLVIVAAAMPNMDGVATIRQILYKDDHANVIICVSNGQRALAIEGLQAGARDFIVKPVSPRRLQKVLRNVMC